jgi:hypothetical protein
MAVSDTAMSKPTEDLPFFSPLELAQRWRVSRTSVDRICRRAGFTRMLLGAGKNGVVRYLKKEVTAYEASRQIVMR